MSVTRRTSKTGFTAYMEMLSAYLDEARAKRETLALVLVDLANLRQLNRSMGYETGRVVLVAAAERLQQICRPRDRIVQYSDTGFALLLMDLRNEGHAELAANRAWRDVSAPIAVGTHRVALEVSIGIAMFPEHADSAPLLMQGAETAQHAAIGGAHWQIYAPEQTAEATGLVDLGAALEVALHDGELTMHYQPKLRLPGAEPCGFEALMRWFHPEHGAVRPDVFIGLAERLGKMESLTWFALNTALRQLRELPCDGSDLNVAVNVTPGIVQKAEFAEIVANALKVWDVAPEQLTIEITETALMTNPQASFLTLSQLRRSGVRISIDDFGTGYSSLAYFKDIPATELKIDRSFVFKMLENTGDRQIVQSVINLAHLFGLKVVAEGIENSETEAALVAMGCDVAQGYYYSKPLSHSDLCVWLDDHRAAATT